MESTSPCNSLIGYSLKWRGAATHWSDPNLFCPTGFVRLGRDQSSFRLSALLALSSSSRVRSYKRYVRKNRGSRRC